MEDKYLKIKEIISENKNNRNIIISVLKDLYKDCRLVNKLMIGYDMSIIDILECRINESVKSKFIYDIYNDYGVEEKIAIDIFDNWCDILAVKKIELKTKAKTNINDNEKKKTAKKNNDVKKKVIKELSMDDFILSGDLLKYVSPTYDFNFCLTNKYFVSFTTARIGDDFETFRGIGPGDSINDVEREYGKSRFISKFNKKTDILLRICKSYSGEEGDFSICDGSESVYRYKYKVLPEYPDIDPTYNYVISFYVSIDGIVKIIGFHNEKEK